MRIGICFALFVAACSSEPLPFTADTLPPDAIRDGDAGDVTPENDAGSDSGFLLTDSGLEVVDSGFDSGPPDAAPFDSSPPSDSGTEPDAASCVGTTSRFYVASSRAWTEVITSSSEDDTARLHGPLVYPTGIYRLGVVVDAPGTDVEIVVRCAFLVQTCANHDDVSLLVSGSDTCRVTGTGTATMGIACAFDDPPRSIEVRAVAATCAPGATVTTSEVTNPRFPSLW